jgi:hypothetical protein
MLVFEQASGAEDGYLGSRLFHRRARSDTSEPQRLKPEFVQRFAARLKPCPSPNHP